MIGLITALCASFWATDGDSVRCSDLRLRIMGPGAPFVSGVDAPEMGRRAECGREAQLAEIAKDRLNQLINLNGVVLEFSGQRDRFDRHLVWIWVTEDVTAGQILISEGLAREWRPGVRIDWCS